MLKYFVPKYYLFITFSLIFLSAAGKDSLFFSTTFKRHEPLNPSGIRIYLIHGGFEGSSQDWETDPYFSFSKTLVDSGAEVITFDRPILKKEYMMADSGKAYRKGFEEQIRKIVAEVDIQFGWAKENVVAGISLGGLHAIMAEALCPDIFSKYIGVLPVTDLKVMPEMKGADPVYFDPFRETQVLSAKTALFIYGDKDERANYKRVLDLVRDVQYITTILYVGQEHVTTPEMAGSIVWWLKNIDGEILKPPGR